MRIVKNISIIVILIVAGWNSVYFARLDEVKASKAEKTFDAPNYANNFWNRLMPVIGQATDLAELLSMLETDPTKTFDKYSHALGIGNLRYFLVKGQGMVDRVEDDYVVLALPDKTQIRIATEFIFGNAVRDASGLIDINEFTNTMDFNNVSAAINKIIRETVLPPFRMVKKGDKVDFAGAIELNKEHVQLNNIEVIPIQLKILE
jgi:predicted lipoprotein